MGYALDCFMAATSIILMVAAWPRFHTLKAGDAEAKFTSLAMLIAASTLFLFCTTNFLFGVALIWSAFE